MNDIEPKEYDPLHPYSSDQLLEMIKRKATTFQIRVRITSHSQESLERLNAALDRRISKQFYQFMDLYSKFGNYTRIPELDMKSMAANLISDLAKEKCFV